MKINIFDDRTGESFEITPYSNFLKNVDVKIRKQWSDALLSGKYNQVRHELKTVNVHCIETCHCCLGVFIEAVAQEEIDMDGENVSSNAEINPHAFPKSYDIFDSEDPHIAQQRSLDTNEITVLSASECNDGLILTFEQIAYLVYPERNRK